MTNTRQKYDLSLFKTQPQLPICPEDLDQIACIQVVRLCLLNLANGLLHTVSTSAGRNISLYDGWGSLGISVLLSEPEVIIERVELAVFQSVRGKERTSNNYLIFEISRNTCSLDKMMPLERLLLNKYLTHWKILQEEVDDEHCDEPRGFSLSLPYA